MATSVPIKYLKVNVLTETAQTSKRKEDWEQKTNSWLVWYNYELIKYKLNIESESLNLDFLI